MRKFASSPSSLWTAWLCLFASKIHINYNILVAAKHNCHTDMYSYTEVGDDVFGWMTGVQKKSSHTDGGGRGGGGGDTSDTLSAFRPLATVGANTSVERNK